MQKSIINAIDQIRSYPTTPTFLACKGDILNKLGGVFYFPEDHTFELDFNKSTLTDVTVGKVFYL